MAEHVCVWCGVSLGGRRRSAKYCSTRCKDFARYESRHGTKPGPFSEGRVCAACGKAFIARTSTRKYCAADCRQRVKLEIGRQANAERARKYRSENPERYREYDKMRRAKDLEGFRERERQRYRKEADKNRAKARERYSENSDVYAAKAREYRAANPSKVKEANARAMARLKNIPEKYREYLRRQGELSRRRAAERALSILLLSQQPET